MVPLTYHVIARAGFTLHGAPGTVEIFAVSFCQTYVQTKNEVLPSESSARGTVLYGKFRPG